MTDLTITLPTQTGLTVLATVALSGVAPGAQISVANGKVSGQLGVAATGIISYITMGSAGILFGQASIGAPDHHLRLTRCLAVTFRVAATLADVYALARVLIIKTTADDAFFPGVVYRAALVFDPKDGMVRYVHTQMMSEAQKSVAATTFREQALERAREALDDDADLRVILAKSAKFAAGSCRVDRRTRRVVPIRERPPEPPLPLTSLKLRPAWSRLPRK